MGRAIATVLEFRPQSCEARRHFDGCPQARQDHQPCSMYSDFGAAALPSYGAVKGAIVQLTKAMAVELAPHDIQVNAIAPGWIATELTAVARDDPGWADFYSLLMTRTPAGRWARLTNAPARLCSASPAASFVTGAIMPVDGGYSVF